MGGEEERCVKTFLMAPPRLPLTLLRTPLSRFPHLCEETTRHKPCDSSDRRFNRPMRE